MPLILEVQTVQGSAFKIAFETLKEVLTDVNMEFRRGGGNDKENKGGIRIMAMNRKKTVLIHLKLNGDNFDLFRCEKKRILIGINMLNFFKLIKTIDGSSTLTLFIDSDDSGKLGIKIENSEKKQVSTYKLNLMDIDNDPLEVPATSFEAVITMPSTDFHKLCRDMSNISDYIEIQCAGKSVVLKGYGEVAQQETILCETPNGVTIARDENSNVIVQGKYELKHLVTFTKCTSICTSIDLYMKNEYPLVIHYQVASLGDIFLCLTPVVEENDLH